MYIFRSRPARHDACAGRQGHPRKLSTTLLASLASVLLAFLAVTQLSGGTASAATADNRFLIPAYFAPTGTQWQDLCQTIFNRGDTATLIMNPNSGPGNAADANYRSAIESCHLRRQQVIGYVPTRYGNRPLADVKADIDRYYQFYPAIGGVFLDEMSNNPSTQAHYQSLYAHIKARASTAQVVGNPGTPAATPWQVTGSVVADTIAIFEGTAADYLAWTPPAWAATVSPSKLAHLVYGTPDAATTAAVCSAARSRNVNWIDVTRDVLPNPWDELPDDGMYDACSPPILPETMPVWRLQVRTTTGDSATAGTDGRPAVRLNGTSQGVRNLNPPTRSAFDRGRVDTYDVQLVGTPSEITMLRVGIASRDDWCVKKVALLINNRLAFESNALPDATACKTIGPGTYVEFNSAQLRTNPAWKAYGRPAPVPTSVPAAHLRAVAQGATGSKMVDTPGVSWDELAPLRISTRSATTLHISHGIWITDPSGIEVRFRATITYDLRLFTGSDGRLHVRKENPSCCYHYGMSDAVASQLDTALTRMTAGWTSTHPVRFGVDWATNTFWS